MDLAARFAKPAGQGGSAHPAGGAPTYNSNTLDSTVGIHAAPFQ
jgi:hypothetical protein